MARIFLSYASADRAQARRLADVLRRAGHAPILKVEESAGETHFDAMRRALETCDHVVACLSRDALRSAWVELEIVATASGLFEQRAERFFIARWEPVKVPTVLAQRPCFDFFPGDAAWSVGAVQLARAIRRNEDSQYEQDEQSRSAHLWMPTNLLPRPRSFVGREAELTAVHQALLREPGAVLLQGPEAIGKTWLALEYAYRHRDEYLGGIWWLPAAVSPGAAWARFFHVLRGHGSPSLQSELQRIPEHRPPSVLAAAARAALARESLPSLVILDGVDSPEWAQGLPGGSVRTLLTARARVHEPAVQLGRLPADEALTLAGQKFVRWRLDDEEARARRRVALKLLACHPAAISLSASLIDHEQHVASRATLTGTPENLALKSAWREAWRRLERRLDQETPSSGAMRTSSSKEGALDACLEVSIQACSQDARRLLLAYALFAPDQPAPHFAWLPSLASLFDEADDEDSLSGADQLRVELFDLGLLRRRRPSAPGGWFEEDYLPRFVRERVLAHAEPGAWRETSTRGLRALLDRLEAAPGLIPMDEDLAHIQALLEVTDGSSSYAEWVEAATRSAACFMAREETSLAMTLLRRALEKVSEEAPSHTGLRVWVLVGLGKVALQLGNRQEARRCLEQVVEQLVPSSKGAEQGFVRRARTAAEYLAKPSAREFLRVLAHVLDQEGDLAGAEELLEQALLMSLDTYGRPLEPETALQLGAVKLRLGDSIGAIRLLGGMLEVLESREGASREELVPVMMLQAAAFRRTGDSVAAEALARRVGELQDARGDDDGATATAAPLRLDGGSPAALKAEALRQLTRQATEADDPAGAARAALLRVDVEGRQGAWEQARKAADEALQLARRAGDDALVAEAYRLRADACLHGSLYEDARLSYEEAIRRYDLLHNERMSAQSRMLLVALLLQLRRFEGLTDHSSWLRRYASQGVADESEREELQALLHLAGSLPGQRTNGKDPRP